MPDTNEHAPQYLKGIELFNACEFFEAHDVWEELWADTRGRSREFYQGLIQVAVALHHFGNGNIRGAVKLYRTSRAHLESYRPGYLDCNLELLFTEMEECFAPALEADDAFPDVAIDPEYIPEIHLNPSAPAAP